jgi:UDP-N-acetylglucosamine--N-acetylmuramyl-(pentapeptide) pyrophosphoryl-undecaprenol N-acetylglucosamine transferase
VTGSATGRERVFALVTGGGTGGHVYPAIAVAQELVRRGHDPGSVRFVGAQRGLEATAVPTAGFDIDLLPGRGIRRSVRPSAVAANLGAAWGLVRAFASSLGIVRRRRPRVVLGVGGYASLACVVVARLRRVPAVVHEQNAAPGLANRVAVRLGARSAIALVGTPLRGATLTGNPVRSEITGVCRAEREQRLPGLPVVVAVVGGSLGAARLNEAALGLYERWRPRSDVAVHHVTGPRDLGACRERLDEMRRPDDGLSYTLVGYEEHMERVYEKAAVLVCRAGAVTVAELAATGTPAVLVPLPGAPNDHQTRNAEALVGVGAAVLVPDAALDAARLDNELAPMVADPARLASMGRAARTIAQPDAAARVADLVEEAAGAA